MMTEFADSQGMDSRNKDAYNEELLNLKEDLAKAFWRLVDTQLTPRQSEVIHLYADGKTQTEIAKVLNVNQSSITKSINGNCDYKNGKRVYGGAIKKIQKLSAMDEDIIEILERISDINGELNSY
jgi:DNA-binding CsgD family transcriptional regulator